MTRLRWLDLGHGERIAVAPDLDGTQRVVVEKPGRPTSIARVASPSAETPVRRRFVIACACCETEMIVTLFEDDTWSVGPYEEDSESG
jgi:hypothetical protein